MVVVNVTAGNCQPQTIVIGRRGTYDTMQIAFDLSNLIEAYGNGVAVLAVKRSQDESAYPAVITQEDNTLTWTVSETDTAYVGAGECQLMWYVDGGLAKTIIYPMVVMRDILATAEDAPDAYQTWVDDLTALGAETLQNAQDAAQNASDAETAKDDAVAAKEAAESALEEFTTPTASATTLDAGSQATAEYSDGNFAFGIPRGADGSPGTPGAPGADGVTPDFSIGTVTTLEPTQPATATITGTAEAPVLNLGIPKGAKGDPGQGGGSVDSVNGQTGAVVLDAGDLEFDDTETYAAGSIGAELSHQKNAISQKAPLIINTASGDIASFADGADNMPIKSLVAAIEPVQDLHGYDHPWPAGSGKNLCPFPAEPTTSNGVTFTPNADGSITISGDANTTAGLLYMPVDIPSGTQVTYSLNNDSVNADVGVRLISTTDGGAGTSWGTAVYADTVNKTQTVTTSFNAKSFNIFVKTNHGAVNITLKVMVELGGTASAFEPYANICPITGRTGLSGNRTSGNLANVLYADVGSGTLVRDSSTGSLHFTNNASSRYASISILYRGILAINPFPKGEYTVSFDIAGTITTNWMAGTRSVSGNLYSGIERVTFSSAGHYSFSFDSSAWTKDYYLSIGRTGNETSDIDVTISNLTIVPGAAEGSFEPYVSQDISVNWQSQAGEVYGGTLDIISGKLVVDHAKMIVDGNRTLFNLLARTKTVRFAVTANPRMAVTPRVATVVVSDILPSDPFTFYNGDKLGVCGWTNSAADPPGLWMSIPIEAGSTNESVKAWLNANPITCVYPIASPVEYQLTPQEVTTLYKNNVVWTDVGPVTVEYPADTTIVVSQQKNAIGELDTDKQDAPSTAGTAGQVLGLDSNLDPVWVNQSGGGDVSNCAPIIINTASGDVASFADGADNRQIRKIVGTIVTPEGGSGCTGCVFGNSDPAPTDKAFSFLPRQSGSGDPSPTNVRSFVPYTITLDDESQVTLLGGDVKFNGDGSADVTETWTSCTIADIRSQAIGPSAYATGMFSTTLYYQTYKIEPSGVTNVMSDSYKQTDVMMGSMADDTIRNFNGAIYLRDTRYSNGTEIVAGMGSAVIAYEIKKTQERPVYHLSNSAQLLPILAENGYALQTFPINWQTVAGTISNGTVTLNEDGSVDLINSDSGTNYHLTGIGSLMTYFGQNNVWIDTGAITECDYPADTKLYVDGLTAPDEDMIANANIASGKYFVVNNQLYLSTAAIAAGASIVPGTNCTATSLAEALNAINT